MIFFYYCVLYLYLTSIVQKIASQADEGNSAHCLAGTQHYTHIDLALRSHLNTDANASDQTRNFLITRPMPYPLSHNYTNVNYLVS